MIDPIAADGRAHLVLVPGFGGFDALGGLEYYAGTTRLFRRWLGERSAPAAIHYFDNLPTAGVRTRAKRLRRYLTKRVLRGALRAPRLGIAGDRIALIGHSTGGLDTRQLLLDLDELGDASLETGGVEDLDGIEGVGIEPLSARQLLAMIRKVVFVSVPQRGTNLANFVRNVSAHAPIVTALRRALGVPASDWVAPTLLELTHWLRGGPDWLRNLEEDDSDILLAILDARAEVAQRTSNDPSEAAAGREAHAQIQAWFGHTHADFMAIEDLVCAERRPVADVLVHGVAGIILGDPIPSELTLRTDRERQRELDMWKRNGIEHRSYATVGRCPFRDLSPRSNTLSLGEAWAEARRGDAESDVVYRFLYAATASGPFTPSETEATCFLDGSTRRVESWDNDGIVNTASMLWPGGRDTKLLAADHADVIGHYRRSPDPPRRKVRRYDSYDIFRSGTGFGRRGEPAALWSEIFEFCIG